MLRGLNLASILQIVKRLIDHPQHVSRIALRLGASPRRPGLPGRPRLLAGIEDRVASDYAAGAGLIELSRRHGAAPATVLRTRARRRSSPCGIAVYEVAMILREVPPSGLATAVEGTTTAACTARSA
jgi:hypothetical protein